MGASRPIISIRTFTWSCSIKDPCLAVPELSNFSGIQQKSAGMLFVSMPQAAMCPAEEIPGGQQVGGQNKPTSFDGGQGKWTYEVSWQSIEPSACTLTNRSSRIMYVCMYVSPKHPFSILQGVTHRSSFYYSGQSCSTIKGLF